MGHFDVFMQDSGSLCDEDFILAEQEGRLNALLESLPIVQEAHTDNLVLQMFSICMFRVVFAHGLPDGAAPMNTSVGWPFYSILISNDASEPSYTDWFYDSNATIHDLATSVNTSNAGKIFVADDIDLYVGTNPSGREAIFLRERWLYLPSQVVSNEIRSIGIYWASGSGTYNARGIMARVRLKDSGGNPITFNKPSDKTLLVQYTISLISS